MVGIEIEDDLEIAGDNFQALVGFAIGADGTGPIDSDGVWEKFLRNEDREGLCAAAIPVVDASENSLLVIQVVV